MKLPWKKEPIKNYSRKTFVELKYKNDIIRIWIDRNYVPYKVEIRFDNMLCGYLNVDPFMEQFRERFHP